MNRSIHSAKAPTTSRWFTTQSGSRVTPERVVASAGLPESLGAIVLETTRRCKLWKSERVDVARELCAHMADALASGSATEGILKDFGDPAETAVLITRAKKRLRPLWWRTWRGCVRAVGAGLLLIVLLYLLAAARFFVRSPNIARNYAAELNLPVLATPKDERAWPIYNQALRAFGPLPKILRRGTNTILPGNPDWPEFAQWLKERGEGFALVHLGASKPQLGYILTSDVDPEYAATLEILTPNYKHLAATQYENPLLLTVLLPHLSEMRKLSHLLSADAHLAAEEKDHERFVANVNAILGMAQQCRSDQFLIQTMVGLALLDQAADVTRNYINTPHFLSAAELTVLAHGFASLTDARLRMDLTSERSMYEDIIQRFYSDDGKGDGHLVQSPHIIDLYRDFGVRLPMPEPVYRAVGPIQSIMLPSRADLNKELDKFMLQTQTDDSLPPWRHDERTADQLYHKVGPEALNRAVPFLESMKSDSDSRLSRIFATRDLTATKRDVVLTVIAMELYRRTNGRFPDSLMQLVPRYLPALPLDPFDGKPLRYIPAASKDAQPTLYSIGIDLIDNNGSPPTTANGHYTVGTLTYLKASRAPESQRTLQERNLLEAAKGDWILWPTPTPPTPPTTLAPPPPNSATDEPSPPAT